MPNKVDGPFVEQIGNFDIIQCQITQPSGKPTILSGITGTVKDGIIKAFSCPAMQGSKGVTCTITNQECPGSNIPRF